jgi:hypothetical protein
VVGGAVTPGYSHTRDHISTLLQAGSDNGPVLIPPFLLYNLLTLAMGVTLVAIARNAARPRTRLGILAGIALVAGGISGAAILAFPQDPIGAPATPTGLTHIALAGVSSLLTMVAIGLAGAWFIGTPERRPLARYSFATLGVVFVGGGIAAIATANLDPWMGCTNGSRSSASSSGCWSWAWSRQAGLGPSTTGLGTRSGCRQTAPLPREERTLRLSEVHQAVNSRGAKASIRAQNRGNRPA